MAKRKMLRVHIRTKSGTSLKVIKAPQLSRAGHRKIKAIKDWEDASAKLVRIVSGPI